jgi:hypothetical protein
MPSYILFFCGMAHLLDLVNVASALADLVHDVANVVGEPLVLPAHLLQGGEALRVPVAHAEQLAGRSAAIALTIKGKSHKMKKVNFKRNFRSVCTSSELVSQIYYGRGILYEVYLRRKKSN